MAGKKEPLAEISKRRSRDMNYQQSEKRVRDKVQGNGREGLKGEGGEVLGGDLEGTEEGGERVVVDLSVETFERCRRKPSRPHTARTHKLYMEFTATRYPSVYRLLKTSAQYSKSTRKRPHTSSGMPRM